ncbi:hypothetical protein H112_00875 [Trichophyton rubrum D6]|uniref:Uncharacterized protein n=3 Tax=Trichophyton TaxID=5550 RepID=F2SZL1_TRIRC|nr:uncharacterized protein TERG_07982 [Trichophyton rubrum CBS 118892]EZF27063.1 hypothetical protein H100_00873 [Trichophyton rubrum MR850]EZF46158.1 hypothetical protein H102_00865 [Trichophyton rubrum CBS 100081]EZF56774.1 hypothetical protein H103_00873 [Trichophyton rubrum CBS 288.86]EZF67415.1 hypothetical protein H104_00857 [Trichophyton rubrum CBS 289.86]EZF78015.1 hypothetical protein H105_00871 [Trichophyton soudanense CBS 452.61]EZF88739.1 hypothetical protein H110_00873 [Trichophy
MVARRQAPEDPIAIPPAVQPPLQATPTWPANSAIPGAPISQRPNTINTWTALPEASPTPQYVPGDRMTSVKPQTTGFSTGILTGAIGGSVAGSALLTLIAAYLFFGRRKSRGESNLEGRQTKEPLGDKNYDIETASSRDHLSSNLPFAWTTDKTNAVGSLDIHAEQSGLRNYIPTPADNKTVESRILTVFDHPALHIKNYYIFSSPSNSESEHLSQYSLILATFHAALFASGSEVTSFLPPPFTAARDFRDMQLQQDQEESQVHFYWRMLTASSYRGMPDAQKQAYLSTRAENISKAVDAFTAAFRLFANPQYLESERIRHPTKVMEDTAELGIWLFEQPCGFEFIWSNLAAGQVVISPTVVKVSDEHGELLQATKTIVKADTSCYI